MATYGTLIMHGTQFRGGSLGILPNEIMTEVTMLLGPRDRLSFTVATRKQNCKRDVLDDNCIICLSKAPYMCYLNLMVKTSVWDVFLPNWNKNANFTDMWNWGAKFKPNFMGMFVKKYQGMILHVFDRDELWEDVEKEISGQTMFSIVHFMCLNPDCENVGVKMRDLGGDQECLLCEERMRGPILHERFTNIGHYIRSDSSVDNILSRGPGTPSSPIHEPVVQQQSVSMPFDIRELTITKTPVGESIEDQNSPEGYSSNFVYDFFCKVFIGKPEFGIVQEISLERRSMTFKRLKAIRHDIVANLLGPDTDIPLSSLGFMNRLTPDFIDVDRRLVIELATTASPHLKSMESSYIRKRVAYENILQSAQVPYFILVVSPTGTMTNHPLSQDQIDSLCLKCRIGLNVESMVEHELGVNLNSDDDQDEILSEIREVVKEYSEKVKLEESWNFNKELIELNRPLTDDEKLHVQRILSETLRSSIKSATFTGKDSAIQDYMDKFKTSETTQRQKLVTIFPMILTIPEQLIERNELPGPGRNINVPSSLYKIVSGIDTKPYIVQEKSLKQRWYQESYQMANREEDVIFKYSYNKSGKVRLGVHELRKSFAHVPSFSKEEEAELATKGVGGKLLSDTKEVLEKERINKLSFHPDTDVSDIEKFWASDDNFVSEHFSECVEKSDVIRKTIFETKMMDEFKLSENPDSMLLYDEVQGMKVVQLGQLISSICTELSFEYKTATTGGEWLIKPLRDYPVILFLYPTGSHVFFFCAFLKEKSENIDTGRIGPRMWETENYHVSDLVSITESYLEHFVKAGPYISMIALHLIQHFKIPFFKGERALPVDYFKCLRYMTLTYLNNKLDHEEMLTNTRFLYMKLFQEMGSNVNEYVERLPDVLRSRLTVFTLKRMRGIMDYYRKTRILRRPRKRTTGIEWEYKNLKCVYHDSFITIEQLVDSFYFSYVVTKNKSSMGDQSFKMFNKIVKAQMEAVNDITREGKPIWGLLKKPEKHRWDYALERHHLETCHLVLQEMHGPSVIELMRKQIWRELSRVRFSTISTLKASSKNYSKGQKLPDWVEGCTKKEFMKKFGELNPDLKGKRPRVITTLSEMIHQYCEETGNNAPTPMRVTIYCLEVLQKRGWFFSDSMIKDQHNGVREIHILEILARMIQFHAELIAKTIAKFFENDTVCNPSLKKNFMKEHELNSENAMGAHISINKSADASKWCQRNHVSQFFYQMNFFCGDELQSFLYMSYWLWTKKRIAVPPELIANLDTNMKTFSTNEDYIRMRESFHKGECPFLECRGSMVEVDFGMFQGICHCASCLKHDIIQTSWKRMTQDILKNNMKIPSQVTIVQGSDDSGALISIPSDKKVYVILVIILLWWKENLAEYSSIWTSKAKTSCGTVNLIEYNSDWYAFGRNIKPLFRWNSACLETGLVERLPERVEQFYNSLSQSLESGASTLLCATVQLCQAAFHYRLMGMNNHMLNREANKLLVGTRNVSLGFFPLEPDQISGVTGFDFQLYLLSKQGVKVDNWEIESKSELAEIEYDSKIDKLLRSSLSNHSIRFSNLKKYEEVVKKTGLRSFESVLKSIEDNPLLLYTTLNSWDQEEVKMVLSLYNPSVKASLSSHQPSIRMMSASSYLLNSPCITGINYRGKRVKRSLISWLSSASKQEAKLIGENSSWFCNQFQYEEFSRFLKSIKDTLSYQEVRMRRAKRMDLSVWGSKVDVDIPLMNMVQRKWFHLRTVSCSDTVFQLMWKSAKAKYPFLRDTYDETLISTGMTDLPLLRLIESVASKVREVHLLDTSTKGSTLWGAVSRIYWPDTKIRTFEELTEGGIRQLKHSIHCMLSYFFKKTYILPKVKQMILGSSILKTEMEEVPVSHFRLKIMRDHLAGVDKLTILNRIEQTKLGILGYFSKRQDRTQGSHKGHGEWIGNVAGIPCVVTMFNQELQSIRMNRLSNIDVMSKSLMRIIRDFRLTPTQNGSNSKSGLYFSLSHGFSSSSTRPEGMAPVVVDRTLKFDVKSKLVTLEWEIHSSSDTLRLVALDKNEMGDSAALTIINETFGSYHWDPNLPSPDIEDLNFQNWCKGLPCRPHTLIHQMMYPDEITEAVNMRKVVESRAFHRPESNMSVYRFNQCFQEFLGRKLLGKSFEDLKYDYFHKEHMKRIRSNKERFIEEKLKDPDVYMFDVLKSLNVEGEEETQVVNDWFERPDPFSDDDSWGDDESLSNSVQHADSNDILRGAGWDIDDGSVNEIRGMFNLYDSTQEELLEEYDDNYKSNLRQIEMFMSPMCDMMADMPSSELAFEMLKSNDQDKQSAPLSGAGGILIYMSTGLGHLVRNNELTREEMEFRDSRAVSDYLTVSAAIGGKVREPGEAVKEIEQIEKLLPDLSGPLRVSLDGRLKKLKSEQKWIEDMKKLQDRGGDLPQIDKNSFMSAFYDTITERGFWVEPALNPDKNFMIELFVTYVSENVGKIFKMGLITESELEDMQSGIQSPILSSSFLRAISFYLHSNLEINFREETIFKHERTMFNKLLTFRLSE